MKNILQLKPLKATIAMLFCMVLAPMTYSQNIFSGEPVQVTGSMNGYSTASSANSVYRRITTTSGNPTDGRGQWVKTYNAQPTGGDVTNSNMAGGGGNGFLFISGPPANRFQNKWVFTSVAQARIDSVNIAGAYNSGNDMGLNMSTAGRYTFVFNDCGYTNTNARYYVGYTANNPVTLNTVTQSIQANNSVVVNVTTSAAPSTGERVFVRYTSASGFASTNSTTILEATSTNAPTNTNWQVIIPAQPSGTSIRYYAFTSTLTLSKLNQLTEADRSLCCLQVNDNSGNNYVASFTAKFNLTFSVDVTNNICGGIDSITVAGSDAALTNWSNGVLLNRLGTTNVYSRIITIDSGVALQYKFRFHRNGVTNWESSFTTTSSNRELVVIKDSTLATPCFGMTTACPPTPAPSTITFVVDLTGQTPDPQGRVYVMGSFTTPTWVGGAIRMTPIPNTPNHYQAIVNNVCPTTFEYKYINGDSSVAANHESFPNPAQRSCTVSNGVGGFNRTYTRINTTAVLLGSVFNTCNVALPVVFVNVGAKVKNGAVLVEWTTASESNNKGFVVQRSIDGRYFEDLAFVRGAGNSKTSNTYQFIDEVLDGAAYYRIKQVDYDGAVSFSETVSVEQELLWKDLNAYPVPFNDQIIISGIQGEATTLAWEIYNVQGMLMKEGRSMTHDRKLVLSNLEGLSEGVYYLTINNNGEKRTIKLLK
ncbi:MAG: T9SS type A sorting domain-containing protein [Bacteroidota bacterium]|jgi:hypothetical protein